MNAAHWHLVVNHLPIVFPVVAVLVLITGMFLRSAVLQRMAFVIFALGAVFAFMAFATGDGAEDVAEKINGVSKTFIHEHEEMAERFALLSYMLGAVSLAALWASWKQKSFAAWLSPAVLLMALVVLFFARQTGTTGGEIMHQEIRRGAVVSNTNTEKAMEEKEKSGRHSDD